MVQTAEGSMQHEITRDEDWSYEDFKRNIIEAETTLPKSERRLPRKIDTGEFGEMADRCVMETASDPEHKERGVIVKLSLDKKKLLIQNDPTVGTEDSVFLHTHLDKSVLDPEMRQYDETERIAMVIHSHPSDHPTSPTDLVHLVTEGGESTSIVGTIGPNFLFIETLETKIIPRGESTAWLSKWNSRLFGKYREIRRRRGIEGTEGENAVANNEVVREICNEHNIAVYSTMGRSGTEYIRADI
jgi:hypothetical protein